MGATLHVPFRSAKKAVEICSFLHEHTDEPLRAFDYDYGPPWWVEGIKLGLKFSAFHGPRKEFVFAVLRWCAINWGRKQRGFTVDEVKQPFAEPVPYVRYDSYESWPVLGPAYKRRVPQRLHWCQVDEFGTHLHPEHADGFFFEIPNIQEILVQANPSREGYFERRAKLAEPALTKAIVPLRKAMRELAEKAP